MNHISIVLAGFATAILAPSPAKADEPLETRTCSSGETRVRGVRGWPETSDAICPYGFVEANRRLASLLEIPGDAMSVERVRTLLGLPPLIRRSDYAPNSFYQVNAGYYSVVAGEDGWEMVLEAYERQSEVEWGRKTTVSIYFYTSGMTQQQEEALQGTCLSEAELLDRATALGWKYEPGEMVDGTAGPIFMSGQLISGDGRSLVSHYLSRSRSLPPREVLERRCAWIGAYRADVREFTDRAPDPG